MMRYAAILILLLAPPISRAEDSYVEFVDDGNDARARRTDPGSDGAMNINQTLPDLLSCRVSKWQSFSPSTNPFDGFAPTTSTPHLFRIDLVFAGLLNPPGPLESSSGETPFQYGPNPLYGFLEIDIDRDRQTGGEPTAEAANHFLANVARFGTRPSSSIGERAVTLAGQTINHTWQDSPQFELSGAEFVLKLCGCESLSIVSTSNPNDPTFSAGDTWIVRSHFLERSTGYQAISRMNLAGGTCIAPGRYDPLVPMRFSHDLASNRTTVSLVYALDQVGAGQLAGLSVAPPVNLSVECDGNSGSIFEALRDVRDGADLAQQSGWPNLFVRTLAQRLASRDDGWLEEHLDPTDWRITALFGTTYSTTIALPPSEGAYYIWTDVGFDCETGDLNGDSMVNTNDRDEVSNRISLLDGTADDGDGVVNGRVAIINFGPDFDIHDLDGNGLIDADDVAFFETSPPCLADWNLTNGLTLQDLFDFLTDWFAGHADVNGDLTTTLQDIFSYLDAFFQGCS